MRLGNSEVKAVETRVEQSYSLSPRCSTRRRNESVLVHLIIFDHSSAVIAMLLIFGAVVKLSPCPDKLQCLRCSNKQVRVENSAPKFFLRVYDNENFNVLSTELSLYPLVSCLSFLALLSPQTRPVFKAHLNEAWTRTTSPGDQGH